MRREVADNVSYLEVLSRFQFPKEAVLFVSSDIGIFAKNMQKHGERFDANAFIDSLQQLVPEGTLIIPGYTDNLLDGDTFDPSKTKPNVGALPNKTMRRKDFIRTKDPLHSVFVWGKDKEELIQREDESTFGPNSMFAYLHEKDAFFLFIDIHIQACFTYIHYIEEVQRVSYRRFYDYNITYVDTGEALKRKVRFYSKKLGVISDIMDLHAVFEKDGDYDTILYRGSKIDVLRSKLVFDKASTCITHGPVLYRFSMNKWAKDFVKRHILRKKGIL